MRKQTPVPDKKEKDVSRLISLYQSFVTNRIFSFLTVFIWTFCVLYSAAFWGGFIERVSGLHRGEHASVAYETRETQNLKKQQEWPPQDRKKVISFSDRPQPVSLYGKSFSIFSLTLVSLTMTMTLLWLLESPHLSRPHRRFGLLSNCVILKYSSCPSSECLFVSDRPLSSGVC